MYEPILPTTDRKARTSTTARRYPRSYGGFEYQKRVWESTAQRSSRVRVVAALQLVLGVLSCWNYLWYVTLFAFGCHCMRSIDSQLTTAAAAGSRTHSARSLALLASKPCAQTR